MEIFFFNIFLLFDCNHENKVACFDFKINIQKIKNIFPISAEAKSFKKKNHVKSSLVNNA